MGVSLPVLTRAVVPGGHEAGRTVGLLYALNLVGEGLGALGVIALLFLLPPMRALAAIGVLGLLAAALASRHPGKAAWVWLAAAAMLGFAASSWLPLRPSEFKDLSQALKVMGARVVAERSSPLGLLSVVESPAVPFRYAPGLSLTALTRDEGRVEGLVPAIAGAVENARSWMPDRRRRSDRRCVDTSEPILSHRRHTRQHPEQNKYHANPNRLHAVSHIAVPKYAKRDLFLDSSSHAWLSQSRRDAATLDQHSQNHIKAILCTFRPISDVCHRYRTVK